MDLLQTQPPTIENLAVLLESHGCDARSLERGRRVAAETGQRLDVVLLRLGLIAERQLAEAAAELLGTPVVAPADYPDSLPPCAAAVSHRFLRDARAVPLADVGGVLSGALADPLDTFTPEALAAATGRRVHVVPAVPVELEAALNRLLPRDRLCRPGYPMPG